MAESEQTKCLILVVRDVILKYGPSVGQHTLKTRHGDGMGCHKVRQLPLACIHRRGVKIDAEYYWKIVLEGVVEPW